MWHKCLSQSKRKLMVKSKKNPEYAVTKKSRPALLTNSFWACLNIYEPA